MDLGDKKLQKRNMATSEHQSPNLKSDWEYANANISTQPMVCGTNNSVNICKGGLGGSSATSSISMMNSFSSSFWDYPNSQNLGSCNNNIEPCTSSSTFLIEKGVPGTSVGIDKPLEMDWNYPIPTVRTASFIQPDAGFHPQKLSQFPADSAFIERAAKFSCFNGENFSDILNPFGISQSQDRSSKSRGPIQGPQDVLLDNRLEVRPQEEEVVRDNSLSVGYGSSKGSPLKNDEENLAMVSKIEGDETEFDDCGSREEPPMAEDAGRPSPVEILGSKKRKRRAQNSELDHMKVTSSPPDESAKDLTETKEKLDPSSSSSTGKANGKNTKDKGQALDAPKEDYIHVRARRGQATNSHSLAERVRREKISERMKFLQELVPGCSKVTGKAVMLDEIINYVQSLQRQVEFLSMKFAAVNPRLEFNFEGLLAKEMLQSKGGPSTMGFLSNMNMPYGPHPQLHPSQQGLVQLGFTDVSNPSELLRRSINSELTALNVGYKKLTHQMPNAWGDELHHAVMNLGANPSFASQDLNGFGSSSHMKVKPR